MRITFVLLTKINQTSKSIKWKIPQEKKRFQINIRLPTISKDTFHRMVEAHPKTYYKIAALIAVFGIFGIAVQFQYTQYRIRRSEYNLSALEIFQKHQKLINLIGSPIKYGYVFPAQRGSIRKDHVQACIPVTGQISKGILEYDASKDEDKWSINAMEFTFKDRAGGKVRIIRGSTQDS